MQKNNLSQQNRFLQAKRHIHFFYERKKLVCDKCELCHMPLDEVKDNYDEILEKIKRPK